MRRLRLSLIASCFLLAVCFVPGEFTTHANPQATSPPGAAVQSPAGQQQPPPSSSEPAEEAPRVQSYTLTPEKYEKAVAFSRAHYRLYFIQFVYSVIVLLLVLRWKLAPRYRDWAEKAASNRFLQVVIFAPLLLLTVDVLGLPTDIYSHWLSLKYDISIQSWPSWFWDWTKGELISYVIGLLLIYILYGVIRRSPRRWWLYFWMVTLPICGFRNLHRPAGDRSAIQ